MTNLRTTVLRALVLILLIMMAPRIAHARGVLRPDNGDCFAAGNTYTFQAQSSGASVTWYCNDTSIGTFVSSTGEYVTYAATGFGPQTILVHFVWIDGEGEHSDWVTRTINQYVVVPVPDDGYAVPTAAHDSEPEMDGVNDFLVPKDQEWNHQQINLRFTLNGPAGVVLINYNQICGGTGSTSFPYIGNPPGFRFQTVIHDGNPTTQYIVSSNGTDTGIRIKGLTTSSYKSDTTFRFRICDINYPEYNDPNAAIAATVGLTIAEIERVDPWRDEITTDPGEPTVRCARVMMDSLDTDSDRYHYSPGGGGLSQYNYQTDSTPVPNEGDIAVEVKVTVKPPVSGITLWAKSLDPDDPSSYEGAGDNDNHSKDYAGNPYRRKGYLWMLDADQWDLVDATAVLDGEPTTSTIVGAFRKTDTSGVLKLILGVTSNTPTAYSGDNYQVLFAFKHDFNFEVPPAEKTCVLTTWKRYYYEVDKMDKPKAFERLSDDFVADGDSPPESDKVRVFGGADFANDDEVRLLDFYSQEYSPTCHVTGITVIQAADPNTTPPTLAIRELTLSLDGQGHDLQRNYDKRASGVVTTATNGYYEANLSEWDDTVKEAFVEYRETSSGASTVPFYVPWIGSDNKMTSGGVDFAASHFANKNNSCQFWICGSGYCHHDAFPYGYPELGSTSATGKRTSWAFYKSHQETTLTNSNLDYYFKVSCTHEACHSSAWTNDSKKYVEHCSHANTIKDNKSCLMIDPINSNIGVWTNEGEMWTIRDSKNP